MKWVPVPNYPGRVAAVAREMQELPAVESDVPLGDCGVVHLLSRPGRPVVTVIKDLEPLTAWSP